MQRIRVMNWVRFETHYSQCELGAHLEMKLASVYEREVGFDHLLDEVGKKARGLPAEKLCRLC